MCEFIAKLRFAFSTDRPGEGQHAKLHRGVLSAPMHTEQYASFLLRTNELDGQISKRPTAITNLLGCCSKSTIPDVALRH